MKYKGGEVGILNHKHVNKVTDDLGNTVSEASIYVYKSASDSLALLYKDINLTFTRENPVKASDTGHFDPIYLIEGSYRVDVHDQWGNLISSDDNIAVSTSVATNISQTFGDVADLLADESLSYAAGTGRRVTMVGHLISVAVSGFLYKVAAEDAVDHHVLTAGGVKLYVQSSQGRIPVQAFNVTNDRIQIEAAIAAADGLLLDFGDGYNYTSDGPILIGDENGKANPLGMLGRSKISFDYEQVYTPTGFGNPGTQQSGFHIWTDPLGDRNFCITGLTLEYLGTFDEGTNGGRVNGIFLSGYQGGKIQNVTAYGFNGCGIFIGGGGSKFGGSGSFDTVNTENITISHCNFSKNRVAGVETANVKGICVTKCQLNENGKAGDTGTGYGYAAMSGTFNIELQIVGNTANYNLRKGIDTHDAENCQILQNICHGNLLWGIFASSDTRGAVKVCENTVTGMTATAVIGQPVYGIYIGQDNFTTKPLTANISDNHVEGGQENGQNFFPFAARSGGQNVLKFSGNTCLCEEVTHFLLADDAGVSGETNLYIHGNRFEAEEVTSYWIRCFEKTLVDLEVSNNAIVDNSAAYFQAAAISYDSGTPPAAAANAMRKISQNHASVLNAAALKGFFEGKLNVRENENYLNGGRQISDPSYTISGGTVSIGDYDTVRIDTEAADASDELTTITETFDRHRIVISAASSSRTVVLKDGVGNLALEGDFSLTHGTDQIELVYKKSNAKWAELSRSNNTA